MILTGEILVHGVNTCYCHFCAHFLWRIVWWLNPVPRRDKPARPTTGAPLCMKGVLAERRQQDKGTKGIKRGKMG